MDRLSAPGTGSSPTVLALGLQCLRVAPRPERVTSTADEGGKAAKLRDPVGTSAKDARRTPDAAGRRLGVETEEVRCPDPTAPPTHPHLRGERSEPCRPAQDPPPDDRSGTR